MEPFYLKTFGNGLKLEFRDMSNRYFGDYYRVCIEVTIHIDIASQAQSGSNADLFWLNAKSAIGEHLKKTKTLERMAVCSRDVEQVRKTLMDDFLTTNEHYFHSTKYLRALVETHMNNLGSITTYGF
ncbi:MAG: hypothetical protein JRE16_02630 [Deltaproteobacteria bacterium]|jgi:hypothetical protein|nr:hypothetical protein [Deltaproteobacteria bacterium]